MKSVSPEEFYQSQSFEEQREINKWREKRLTIFQELTQKSINQTSNSLRRSPGQNVRTRVLQCLFEKKCTKARDLRCTRFWENTKGGFLR